MNAQMFNNVLQNGLPIQAKAILAVMSAQLCFSGWHILGSIAFRAGANPLVFLMYRLIFGTALMQLYIEYYKLNRHIDQSDYRRMFIVGLLQFATVLSGSLALTFIAPSRFAIFQPTTPCIVAAISILFKLESVNAMKLVGIALAVAGAFVAELWKVGKQTTTEEVDVPLGIFCSIVNVTAMACSMIVVKPLLNKYDSAVVSATYFTISTVAILIVVVCRLDQIPLSDFAFSGLLLPWLAVGYVAVFATMYSFSAINWGGKHLPPTVTTVFSTFQPVGTIILSATLLGAVVTIPEILGGLLIVLGLLITSLAQARSHPVRASSDLELASLDPKETISHKDGMFVELHSRSSSYNPMICDETNSIHDATYSRVPHSPLRPNSYVYEENEGEIAGFPPILCDEEPEVDLLDL